MAPPTWPSARWSTKETLRSAKRRARSEKPNCLAHSVSCSAGARQSYWLGFGLGLG